MRGIGILLVARDDVAANVEANASADEFMVWQLQSRLLRIREKASGYLPPFSIGSSSKLLWV
jgi:hypothetical protein